jgi:uncharacterized protein
MRILITGSSGFIGTALREQLGRSGHEIFRLVRCELKSKDELTWNPSEKILNQAQLENFDAVIHLAGENIASGRWSDEKQKRLYNSRVGGTELLCRTMTALKKPPKCVICASAIGAYGSRGDEIMTEKSAFGQGFLPKLVRNWEEATKQLKDTGIRSVNLRFGVVLGKNGGMLKRLRPIFNLGLGAKLGNGKQWLSWISITDAIRAIEFLLGENLSGAVNVTAPNPVTNAQFTSFLAKILNRPAFGRIPVVFLKALFGNMADEMLLSSTRVYPEKLLAAGFNFNHPDLFSALQEELR